MGDKHKRSYIVVYLFFNTLTCIRLNFCLINMRTLIGINATRISNLYIYNYDAVPQESPYIKYAHGIISSVKS